MIKKWKHILYGARISRKDRLRVCYSSWFGVCFIKPVLQGNINICILCNKIPFSTVVFFSFLIMRHLKKLSFLLMPNLSIQGTPSSSTSKETSKLRWKTFMGRYLEVIKVYSQTNRKWEIGNKSHTVRKIKILLMNTSSLWPRVVMSQIRDAHIHWPGAD